MSRASFIPIDLAALGRSSAELAPGTSPGLAPDRQCVVCARDLSGGGTYLSGSTPLGAVACTGECTAVAVSRHAATGRVDAPNRGEP